MKQDLGADFLITQLFYDNDYFYRFQERAPPPASQCR